MDEVIARSVDQRLPSEGEPVCIVCGRYGAYVCDATDEDVCSLECRDVCIQRKEDDKLRKKLGIKVSGTDATQALMTGFEKSLYLPQKLVDNLTVNSFERPTPVQMQTIPCVLKGYNVLTSAPTGTGKTAAYLIPAIAQILLAREKEDGNEIMALIMAPIRELALQIEMVAKLLMRGIPDMKTALLVGGFPIPTQRYRLQSGVQLIVATPGRFLDIFMNYGGGKQILQAIRLCVVDEVDMMLDVGFRPQISQIASLVDNCAKECDDSLQMLFFSATVSDEIEEMVQQIMKGHKNSAYLRVEIQNDNNATTPSGTASFSLNPNVKHQVRWTVDKDKKKALFSFLEEKQEQSTLVFVSSKIGATMLAEAIQKCCGVQAASIHADKIQTERLSLLEAFINMEIPVLVSTNVLSRGMDLLHVQNVVVFDFPKKIADYVHLLGRTGRGDDCRGTTLSLVTEEDRLVFRDLISLLRRAKVRVPREVYQSVHSSVAQQRTSTNDVVVDESKRAFRVRKQDVNETSAPVSEWKEWNYHKNKKQRYGG